jgi:hypothetical protein
MKRKLLLTLVIISVFSIPAFCTIKDTETSAERMRTYVSIKKLPHAYDISTALANGDAINSLHGRFNTDRLEDFIQSYKKRIFDYVRTTQYTDEGQPVIHELVYKNGKLRLTIDTTRDDFGKKSIEGYTVKKIDKTKIEYNDKTWIEYRAYLNEYRYFLIFFE